MDISGLPESIKKFKHSDIVSYYQTHYRPSSSIVVICGNPKNFDWEKTVEKTFSSFVHQDTPSFVPYKKGKTEELVAVCKKVDQTHFSFSALTYPRQDERNYALAVLTTILAGGSSSRLFTKIREEKGWAYDVRSDISTYHDTGTFSVYGGLMQDKVADAVSIIKQEIDDIKTNGPCDEELERAKKNLRGHLALSLEDSMEIAGYLADEIFYLKKVRTIEEIIEGWNKVSAADVKKIAQDIFQSDKMGLAIIGPKDYKKDLENLF
jgi:predicted Zn-dependent peptidase